MKHMQNIGGYFGWTVYENQVASTTTYDRSTGVTTYMPRNISGNWQMELAANYGRGLDKDNRLTVTDRLSGSYDHNVDYITDDDGTSDVTEPARSVVHNTNVTNQLRLEYRDTKELYVALEGNLTWKTQNSSRDNFTRLSAVDFSYGITSHGPIIWGFNYDTSLRVYSRRGYNDSQMNDNHVIWNLNISRSFLKGKPLTLQLQVIDILGEMSNTNTTINTQGRTETWYNSIPRYALLHVIYKFNTMKKK